MLIFLIILILVLGLFFVSTKNGLIQSRNTVEEAFSTMDVYLKQRWDLVPNLVSTVKGYASHEESVLKEITELRNTTYSSLNPEQKINENNKLSSNLNKLLAISENYPELKASENFNSLQAQLTKIEGDIANARKYYNGAVKQYNNKVEMFPSSIIANMLNYQKREMFIANEGDRENVKVEF